MRTRNPSSVYGRLGSRLDRAKEGWIGWWVVVVVLIAVEIFWLGGFAIP